MDGFSLSRAMSIARKEVFHILRDPFTLAMALGLPVFLVSFFGIAIDFNVKNIALSVHDADKTQTSRRLTDVMGSSNYFLVRYRHSIPELFSDLESERAKAALIIPPNFEKDFFGPGGSGAKAQLLLDGADNSTVGVILSYLGGMQNIIVNRLAGTNNMAPIDLETRFLFNPELKTQWFIVPGLAVLVLALLAVLLTSITVAREWENGSMELLLSTPVQPFEIILGKLIPYGVLGMLAVVFVYLVARLAFGVPFQGSHLVYIAGCLIFLGCYLAQGLLISVAVRQQQLAMQIAIMSGLLPTMLLSGFVFAIEDMNPFFRVLTGILPARWFMTISRAIFLQGTGTVDLLVPFGALVLLCTFLTLGATKRFKKDLEP